VIHSQNVTIRRLTALLLAAFLAGCGKSSIPTPSLTIAVNAGVEGTALKTAAQEWGRQNATRIEVVELPYNNLFEKLLMDLTSRTGSYDVIMMDDPWFPKLVEGGNLTPLPEDPAGDFIRSCLDVCRHPYQAGKYYALPYVGNSQLFFYRKDLFDKYHLAPPDTWDQVLTAAKTIQAKEKMYGYVARAAPGNAVVTDFMPILWAFGGDILNADGDPAVNTVNGVAALRLMIELGKYSPPGYAGFNADEVSAHLLQATAPMSINWPAWIAAMDDPARSKVVGKIDFAQVPSAMKKGQAELGTWLLGVPSGSKNADRAFQFITWATAPEQMKTAALRGNPPTRRSVFESADLKQKFRAFPAQLASLETARPRPRTPLWNEIENALGIYLSKANAGSMKPEEAMKRAQDEIEAILRRSQ
jgi:multiple sugar transport system substrate-binding protein